jgi:hypothetical protein
MDAEKSDDYTPESSSPTRPTSLAEISKDDIHDFDDHLQPIATGRQHDGHDVFQEASLARTKSIAETLSLPHEIAFVTIVCMANFFTRTYSVMNTYFDMAIAQ